MSPQAEANLVFPGRDAGRIPWALLGFILLSACVHAFGFYIFQTIYPPAAHVGPPPVQVGLITPGTPEADAILRWIDSEDPARAAQPTKAYPSPGLMSLPYNPSYSTVHAKPVIPAVTEQPVPYPAGVSGLDLVQMAAAHPTPAASPAPPVSTVLSFTGPLESAPIDSTPSLDALRQEDVGDVQIQPARYLLGVSAQGEVQFVFLQDSSGDKTLDADAGRLLEQVRFHPSTTAMTWGFATFYWGAAVYAQPTASAP